MPSLPPRLSSPESVFLSFVEVKLSVITSPTFLCLHLSATPNFFYKLRNQINYTYCEFSVMQGRVMKEFEYEGFVVSCVWVEESASVCRAIF